MKLKRPLLEQKDITYRKLRSVDTKLLQTDIMSSTFLSDYRDMEVTPLVANFESTLTSLLDTHAPTKKRTIILRPHAPWYNDSIDVEKKKRRKLEQQWRKLGLCIDRELYITLSGVTNDMIKNAKFNHYSSIITENKGNQLLHRKSELCYPTSSSNEQLVNDFAAFFHEKISKMRCTLSTESDSVINPLPDSPCCQWEFPDFRTVSSAEVSDYLISSGLKTCDLDTLPSILLRKCLNVLLPVITRIVNLLLTTGNIPHHFKEAMVRPKLKKDSLDYEYFPHFRAISNLKLLSKVTEKAAASQLIDYLNTNGLQEALQSAYKIAHSTESSRKSPVRYLECKR